MNGFNKNIFFGLKCMIQDHPVYVLLITVILVFMVAIFGFRIAEYNAAKVELYTCYFLGNHKHY